MNGKVFVGIDWGHEESQVIVQDLDGELLFSGRVATEYEALNKLVETLRSVADGRQVEVVVEAKAGPVVQAMLGAGFDVYSVNPKKVDSARALLSMSAAKDDRRDALAAVFLLRTLKQALHPLSVKNPSVSAMRRAARRYQDVSEKRVAVRHQLRELCREYFPALLQLGDFETQWMVAVAKLLPSPTHAQRMTEAPVAEILKKLRVRKHTAATVLKVLRQPAAEIPWEELEAYALDLRYLCDQLQLLTDQLLRLGRRLDELLLRFVQSAHETGSGVTDVEILRSHPGIGRYVVATLIGEGLTELLKGDLEVARCYAGAAPVTVVTGKRQTNKQPKVVMRRACNSYVRRALHIFGEKALQHDDASRARYASLRARGHTHGRAIRQLCDTKLKQLRAMLRDRTLYAPARSVSPTEAALQ